MSYQGRSLDDLPLAAYSNGAVADEPEEEAVSEPPRMSQQDAVALAMGMAPAASAAPTAASAPTAETVGKAAPGAATAPRLSLPKPSLPRLSLPRPSFRLPRLGDRTTAAVAMDPPFRVTPQPATPSTPSPFAMSVAQAPAARPVQARVPGATPAKRLADLGVRLRNPSTAVRDPRVLFGGMIGIGVVVLAASMLLGGGPATGGAAPGASASAAPGAGGPTTPGPATITVAGDFEATFSLTGTSGFGKPADGPLVATWDDGAGSSVSLTAPVGSTTRTTSAQLILVVTVVRNGTPVTFTSEAGECTVGMAQARVNVTGSFVCPEITSDGGRFTVKLTGNYQT